MHSCFGRGAQADVPAGTCGPSLLAVARSPLLAISTRYNLTHAGALRTPGDWVQTDIDSLLSLQPEPIGQPGETVEPPEE